jgi:uncharacterized membrane protein (UPF0127 family)
MRTSPLPRHRRLRRAAVAAVASVALAGCAGSADEALTGAQPRDDVSTDDGGTDAQPRDDASTDEFGTDAQPHDDIAGGTSASPSDDVATDGGEHAAQSRIPPLDDAIDDWPETTVTLDGGATIEAKVADQPDRRQQGLMHVPELPDGVGMLFLFEEPRTGGFWMKNTLVPLDIAYLRDGEVVSVMQMEPCEEDPCPTYDPGVEYDAAVEVAQGTLAEAGIEEGASVTWTEPVEVSTS